MPRILGTPNSFLGYARKSTARKRRCHGQSLRLEVLEGRIVLSTDTFVNPAGGNWFVASNWSLGIPQAGNDVAIPALSSGSVVTYAAGTGNPAVSLNSISLDSPLTISSLLTVNGDITGQGAITLSGSSGILSNANVTDITVVGSGGGIKTVTLGGNATVQNNVTVAAGGLTINGNVTLDGGLNFSGTQTIGGTGTIAVETGGFSVGSNATLTLGPNVTVSGNFAVDGPGISVVKSVFDIQGTVETQGDGSFIQFLSVNVNIDTTGQLIVGNVSSYGNIDDDNPNVDVTNTLTNSGLISLGSNSQIQVGGGGFSPTGFTQAATGTLSISIQDPPQNGHQGNPYLQTSTAALGGTLTASLVNGYKANSGQTFVAVSSNFDGTTGSFATFQGTGLQITGGGDSVILSPTNPTSLPDIDVINASYSAQYVSYSYIVSGTLSNYTIGVYQSATPTFTFGGSNTPIATYTSTGSTSNTEIQNAFNLTGVTLDPTLPYLLVVADPANKIHEFNENNNVVALQINPILSLAITSPNPPVVALDTPFNVQVSVYANGTVDQNFSGSVTLSNGLTANAVNGIANISNPGITTSGIYYDQATSAGLTSAAYPITIAYTPSQIRTSYGIDAIPNFSITQSPDGTGQTIAILVPYDNPQISTDLATFDTQFNIPSPPVFAVVNAQGLPTPLPGPDPCIIDSTEEALDVEWAHAIAPGANIIVFEFDPNIVNFSQVAKVAADFNNVSTVSMSFTASETSSETMTDSNFTTPSGHQGVTFIAATGDKSQTSAYPADSPNVLAVGGTTLRIKDASGDYPGTTSPAPSPGETGWSNGGGGESAFETEPSYQTNNGVIISDGMRATPDVSFDADSATGVSIYDSNASMLFGNPSWTIGLGTSLGTPSWAGLLAIANQGRVAGGRTTLDGPSQTLPALYYIGTHTSDFNDITIGTNSNGQAAGIGYDLLTGLGTPQANLLIPALISWQQDVSSQLAATKSGLVFNRATQLFGGTLTLTNTGTTTFIGSFEVVLNNLSPGVTVANPSGYTANGTPYITVNFSGLLAPGQSVTFSIAFKNPKNVSIFYTPDIIY